MPAQSLGVRAPRGPIERLARRILRKEKMIQEYERIARESEETDSRGKATRDYFQKRAADFRLEKAALDMELARLEASR